MVILCILPLTAAIVIFGLLGFFFNAADRWWPSGERIPRAKADVPKDQEEWLRQEITRFLPSFRTWFRECAEASPQSDRKALVEQFNAKRPNMAAYLRSRFEKQFGPSSVLFPRAEFDRIVAGALRLRA